MLTLHLNAADLSRTVVRSAPSVMLELAAAGQRLFQSTVPPHLAVWRARTRAALRPVMRPYLDLCHVPYWLPDFLTPATNGSTFAAGLDQVLATPAAMLRAELQPRIAAGDVPSRVGDLASGNAVALHRLRTAMVAFHDVAVAPYWSEIAAAVRADRAARGHSLVDRGIDHVLRTLSPYVHWTASNLSYRLSYECAYGPDVDIEPTGRGVTLVPSYLLTEPCVLAVEGAPLVLAYPIEKPPDVLTTRKPLTDLLGRTRAAVLGAIAGGRSTTEVARDVGISNGSASQHAAILRSAGLITTHRTGSAVLHSLTPLGESLLRAGARNVLPVAPDRDARAARSWSSS